MEQQVKSTHLEHGDVKENRALRRNLPLCAREDRLRNVRQRGANDRACAARVRARRGPLHLVGSPALHPEALEHDAALDRVCEVQRVTALDFCAALTAAALFVGCRLGAPLVAHVAVWVRIALRLCYCLDVRRVENIRKYCGWVQERDKA